MIPKKHQTLLERARDDNPNRLYILSTLGQVYIDLGRYSEARECLSLASERYPEDSEIRAALKMTGVSP